MKHIAFFIVLSGGFFGFTSIGSTQEFSCVQKGCKRMKNCAEAVYHLRQCGHKRRDGDKDGIPCEKLCGKSLLIMESRLLAQGYNAVGAPPASAPAAEYSCKPLKSCGEMLSCAEAEFQLKTCKNANIDGNRDGIPCNALCR